MSINLWELGSYEAKFISKSIHVIYYSDKQVVTRLLLTYSSLKFASAKINKKTRFARFFGKNLEVLSPCVAVVAFFSVGKKSFC